MSATVCRLILCLAAYAAAPLIYVITLLVLEPLIYPPSPSLVLLYCSMITGFFLIVAWLYIWWTQVHWTPLRLQWTIIFIAIWTTLCATLTQVLHVVIDGDAAGIVLSGMVWAIGWLVGSTLIWRETRSERVKRIRELGMGTVHCPQCDYNLTGLREATCPECGTKYTLDQLFASISEIRRMVDEGK